MAAMTFTVDVPDTITLNRQALQQQLTAFAKILISYAPRTDIMKKKEDMHIFDCFSGDWGGDRDSHEIADELHDGRVNSRTIESW